MKAKHKSAIFILGITALIVSRIRCETYYELPEKSPFAPDTTLSDALINHAPIVQLNDIIQSNPGLLREDMSISEGKQLPLEYATRGLLLKESVALTTIHPESYPADYLIDLCTRLILYNTYDPTGPQHTLKILQVLYATTPKDLDLPTYQLRVRLSTTSYFPNQNFDLLVP